MKKKCLILKTFLTGFFMVCISTNLTYGKELVDQTTSSIPAELNTIFTKSCMKCHGAGGSSFVLSKVDFSKWDQYTAEIKAKKAKSISRVVSNGSMPPRSFLKANPGAVLLKDQIELIRKWSDDLSAQSKK